ncbi:hypothetical protein F4780DRAFT_78916 [Xylariomycetidae sp. FL0641]|nr:hypothetical protein F4780DRAFT_78916 [Xylariomycetidae sp. FL0641]
MSILRRRDVPRSDIAFCVPHTSLDARAGGPTRCQNGNASTFLLTQARPHGFKSANYSRWQPYIRYLSSGVYIFLLFTLFAHPVLLFFHLRPGRLMNLISNIVVTFHPSSSFILTSLFLSLDKPSSRALIPFDMSSIQSNKAVQGSCESGHRSRPVPDPNLSERHIREYMSSGTYVPGWSSAGSRCYPALARVDRAFVMHAATGRTGDRTPQSSSSASASSAAVNGAGARFDK